MTVESLSVVVPKLASATMPFPALPPVIVSPVSEAVTSFVDLKHPVRPTAGHDQLRPPGL